jgi:hypothetical protein
MACFSLDWRPV